MVSLNLCDTIGLKISDVNFMAVICFVKNVSCVFWIISIPFSYSLDYFYRCEKYEIITVCLVIYPLSSRIATYQMPVFFSNAPCHSSFKILENSRHPLNQSDAKLKTIVSWSFAFSRASRSLLVFNSCSYWLMTRFTLLITVIIFVLVFRHLFENCPLVTKAPSPLRLV